MLGGVFISYRREDSAGFAGRIYDRLTRRLDAKSVFLDVDNIQPGLDFVEVLSEKLGVCDALIAIIGKNWNSIADQDGRRRLDNPDDFVRIEIEAALKRGIRVIPVLVDGATMPRREDLPDSLQKLHRRQAIEISHNRFDSDVERLTHALSLIEEELGLHEAAVADRAAREELQKQDTGERAKKAARERIRAEIVAAKSANVAAAKSAWDSESVVSPPPRLNAANRAHVYRPSRRWSWRVLTAFVGGVVLFAALLLPAHFQSASNVPAVTTERTAEISPHAPGTPTTPTRPSLDWSASCKNLGSGNFRVNYSGRAYAPQGSTYMLAGSVTEPGANGQGFFLHAHCGSWPIGTPADDNHGEWKCIHRPDDPDETSWNMTDVVTWHAGHTPTTAGIELRAPRTPSETPAAWDIKQFECK